MKTSESKEKYELEIKRIYEEPAVEDGYRILVDRLWPRGVSKERARLNEWAKAITPSTEIRKAFNHEADKMTPFSMAYRGELGQSEEAEKFVVHVAQLLKEGNVTLLYGARDPQINHAIILKNWLEEQMA